MPNLTHKAAAALILKKTGIARSPLWPATRKKFLAKMPKCAACDETVKVEVHHMYPFHYVVDCGRPDLELDDRNFVTLCERPDRDHHLLVGHLDDWQSYNSPKKPAQLAAFIKKYSGKSLQEIKADAAFKAACKLKFKHLDKMTVAERAAFKQMLDALWPHKPAMMAKAVKARVNL